AELPAFLGLADVLASPRRRGVNTPFQVYTYLASGRPLVATRLLTPTQVLDHGNARPAGPAADTPAAGAPRRRPRPAGGRPRPARRARARADRARVLPRAPRGEGPRRLCGGRAGGGRARGGDGYTAMMTGATPSLLRVLVVEDSVDTADIMAELLKRRGHEVQ